MIFKLHNPTTRAGGIYIAVLGTSLIVSLLAIASLTVARIQNRLFSASTEIRQAQLNALAAIELGLLTMKQDADWRTTYADLGAPWFTRATGPGSDCSLRVAPADAVADDVANAALFSDPSTPVKLVGTGRYLQAVQLAELVVGPQRQPLDVLRAATAAAATGAPLDSQSAALDSNAWSAIVSEYQSRGRQITPSSLPSNLARNPGVESPVLADDPNWTGTPPGMPTVTAQVSRSSNWDHSGNYSLRVSNRTSWQAGAVQRIEHFVKPGQQYDVEAWVSPDTAVLLGSGSRDFHMTLHVKGTNDGSALVTTSPSDSATWLTVLLTLSSTPAHVTGRLTVPTWSGDLEYAFVKIADASSSGGTDQFYVDDLLIRGVSADRYIFRQALGPGVNPFGTPDDDGIYWMDCGGNSVVIERTRILGTLLLLNPGPGSRIDGPVHLAPYLPGYPALLVQGNFTIAATRRALGETENTTNYNPAGAVGTPGMPYDFGTSAADALPDADTWDIYPSEIRGLVAVSGNLTIANSPVVCGPVIVGGAVANAAALTVEAQNASLLSPPPGFLAPHSHLRRPASAHKAVLP